MIPPENTPNLAQTAALTHPTTNGLPHILVVDDDNIVRSIIQFGLEKLGYTVSSADSGKTALETAAQHQDIQLLLTDVLMPGMNGVELAEKFRKTHPHIQVLYVSGHLRATISTSGVPVDSINFLQKPFKSAQLDDRIKTILSKRS